MLNGTENRYLAKTTEARHLRSCGIHRLRVDCRLVKYYRSSKDQSTVI